MDQINFFSWCAKDWSDVRVEGSLRVDVVVLIVFAEVAAHDAQGSD